MQRSDQRIIIVRWKIRSSPCQWELHINFILTCQRWSTCFSTPSWRFIGNKHPSILIHRNIIQISLFVLTLAVKLVWQVGKSSHVFEKGGVERGIEKMTSTTTLWQKARLNWNSGKRLFRKRRVYLVYITRTCLQKGSSEIDLMSDEFGNTYDFLALRGLSTFFCG